MLVDGVDLADHDAAVERQVDLPFDLHGLELRPRRALEGGLQFGEPVGVDDVTVGVEFEGRGIELVGAADAPVALLHPGVEQGAEPRRPVGALGHGPTQLRSHGIRVAHEVLEGGCGDAHGKRHDALARESTLPLLEQQLGLARPPPDERR
ncbi:hypothetical protein GCM10025869_01900 [Homoserinibacter gongjuensis]|uniref:Uncharacterized protein n=1 Tax=Homoserinibacter gongjuensis TaxID=1162968 RepID=A0ABQ6JSK7_9MICO|nr:hypothetical protein GCM10025869_01900 [Homoserinibacter gongjuensis]